MIWWAKIKVWNRYTLDKGAWGLGLVRNNGFWTVMIGRWQWTNFPI